MVSVCFYLHVHQPLRLAKFTVFDIGKDNDYFDHEKNKMYLDRIVRKSYLPTNKVLLNLINKTNGRFKVSFSITGVLLEQLTQYPEVLQSFRDIIDTGCAELIGETYYHSLASVYSKEEFKEQIKLQEKKLKETFGKKPKIFRNTELIFQNEIGKIVEELGYKGILAEGADKILGWRSPCFLYRAKDTQIALLLKHYRLSDDIAFRFSERKWEGWPLTADKFASWINKYNGNGEIVNLFLDYETFGEHQWEETGIFEFLNHFPFEVLKRGDEFILPGEAINKFKPVAEIDFPFVVSWADTERDLSAWLGNKMQQLAAKEIYSLEKDILATKDIKLIDDWRKLQTADHFYYMCTKWFTDGDVHKYFNPYESPYDAFIIFMNILNDLKLRLKRGDKKMDPEEAKRILADVAEEKVFWCHDGSVFKNLIELKNALGKMSDETFSYHVNDEKNDFSNWIRDVIGDGKLAKDLLKFKDRTSTLKRIRNRINQLNRMLRNNNKVSQCQEH